MAKQFKEVTMTDFNTSFLRRMAKEGRLFVMVDDAETKMDFASEIKHYVAPLQEVVEKDKRLYINKVWDAILSDEEFAKTFANKKGRQFTAFSKYAVMAIVGVMWEKKLYASGTKTELHNILEHTTLRTAYFYSLSTGLNRQMMRRLEKIIEGVNFL